MTVQDATYRRSDSPSAGSDEIPAGRIPPHSIESEVCVLGSMILDASAVDIVVQINQADHFYRPAHQIIYQTLVDLRQDTKPIDLVLLKEALDSRKLLPQVGGVEYLVALAEGVPNSANAEYYAKIVRDKAMLRQLILAGTDMVREAYETADDAGEVIDRAESSVFKIASQQIGSEAGTLKAYLEETFAVLESADGRLVTGLDTGYHVLNEMTTGFHGGEMIILAARPSMGKTSLLMNIAEHMAVVEKYPVAFFSLEMSGQQIAQRLLASHAQFDMQKMRRGMISAEDWTRLQLTAGDLQQAPIYIDDSPVLTVLQLRAKARRLQAAHGIKAIFIDYLQLMSYHGKADSRQQQITEISRGIKALARELDVPVITAAQLNRGPTDRESHRPRMSDLRESGSIEQDADVVLLLHCEDYYHRGEPDYIPNNITELILAKQRNGPTGIVKLVFRPEITRFESAAPEAFAE